MSIDLLRQNISAKYGFQWIAPERTGSRKVAEILSYYGFTNNGNKIFQSSQREFSYFHGYEPSDRYENFKLIYNTRNPYSRVYSLFKNFYGTIKEKDSSSFKKYLINHLSNGMMEKMITNPILDERPDYVIRLENMTEDLMKLPFIFDVLNEKQIRLLTEHGKPIEEWESFYDQESKDIVYEYCKHQFIFGEYSK